MVTGPSVSHPSLFACRPESPPHLFFSLHTGDVDLVHYHMHPYLEARFFLYALTSPIVYFALRCSGFTYAFIFNLLLLFDWYLLISVQWCLFSPLHQGSDAAYCFCALLEHKLRKLECKTTVPGYLWLLKCPIHAFRCDWTLQLLCSYYTFYFPSLSHWVLKKRLLYFYLGVYRIVLTNIMDIRLRWWQSLDFLCLAR